VLGATIEQGLFGGANAVVSWYAARSLGVQDLATFFLIWVWSWSLVGVLSEAVGTPLGLEIGQGSLPAGTQAHIERVVKRGAAVLSGITIALFVLANPPITAAAPALTAAGLVLVLIRRFRFMENGYRVPLISATARFCFTFASCAAWTTLARIDSRALLCIAVAAALIGSWSYGRRVTFGSTPRLHLIVIRALRGGGAWLAAGTLIRIVGFSAGLATVLAWRGDSSGVATLAALGSLASIPQLFSGSLPLALQPPLLRSLGNPTLRRRETRRYITATTAIAGVIGLLVAALYTVSREILLGTSDASLLIRDTRWEFTILAMTLITSSSLSGYLAAVSKTRTNFIITALVAPLTLIAAMSPLSPAWLAATPYALHTIAASGICALDALTHSEV
jgi:hypothetical protein